MSNIRGKFPKKESDYFSMSILRPPMVLSGDPIGFSTKEVAALTEWIELNQLILLKFWISDDMTFKKDVLPFLKKLPNK